MSFKRRISFKLGKRKFNLKIYQLFLLILIFSLVITGTTYAYFMTSAFIKNKITVTGGYYYAKHRFTQKSGLEPIR